MKLNSPQRPICLRVRLGFLSNYQNIKKRKFTKIGEIEDAILTVWEVSCHMQLRVSYRLFYDTWNLYIRYSGTSLVGTILYSSLPDKG